MNGWTFSQNPRKRGKSHHHIISFHFMAHKLSRLFLAVTSFLLLLLLVKATTITKLIISSLWCLLGIFVFIIHRALTWTTEARLVFQTSGYDHISPL